MLVASLRNWKNAQTKSPLTENLSISTIRQLLFFFPPLLNNDTRSAVQVVLYDLLLRKRRTLKYSLNYWQNCCNRKLKRYCTLKGLRAPNVFCFFPFGVDSPRHPRCENTRSVQLFFPPRSGGLWDKNSSTSGTPPSSSMSLLTHWPIRVEKGAEVKISTLSCQTGSCSGWNKPWNWHHPDATLAPVDGTLPAAFSHNLSHAPTLFFSKVYQTPCRELMPVAGRVLAHLSKIHKDLALTTKGRPRQRSRWK